MSTAAAALALFLLGAAPARDTDRLAQLHGLLGRRNCASSDNASKGATSEDMMSYANRTWTVIDMEPSGVSSVLKGPDTGVAHIALITKYPKAGLTVTFDLISATKYVTTFGGTLNGKRARWKDTCTKA